MTIAAVSQRRLGNQGLVASAQGLGCMGMTYSYTNTAGWGGDLESIQTIHRALELGVNFLDTSDIYGPFTNEKLVGKRFAEYRNKRLMNSAHANDQQIARNSMLKPQRTTSNSPYVYTATIRGSMPAVFAEHVMVASTNGNSSISCTPPCLSIPLQVCHGCHSLNYHSRLS